MNEQDPIRSESDAPAASRTGTGAPGAPHNPLMSRRQLTVAGAGLAAGLGFAGAFGPLGSAGKAAGTSSEDALLDQLYKDALAEGGQLVAYMGGDTAHQNDSTRAAFLARFPEMKFTLKTDLSKYLDGMIDNQLARHRLEPDLAVSQTLWTSRAGSMRACCCHTSR